MYTYGIKINVADLEQAVIFYCDKLGFEIEDSSRTGIVILKSDTHSKLLLCKADKLTEPMRSLTRLSFTLQVNDLDRAIERMKSLDIEFAEKEIRKEGVGNAISILDPFGRAISLMHQTIVPVDPFKEPRLYNFGFVVPDMDKAREFYAGKLGLVELSEKYLPRDMPLGHRDKSFAFMLHVREGIEPIKVKNSDYLPYNMLVLQATDLPTAVAALKNSGVLFISDQPEDGPLGKKTLFADPFGNVCELFEAAP